MNTIIKNMVAPDTTWENITSDLTSLWQCVDGGILVTWIEPVGGLHASYGSYHLTYTFGKDYKPNEVVVAYEKMRGHLLDMANTETRQFIEALERLEKSDRRFSVLLAVFFVLTVAGGVVVMAGVLL